MSDIALEQLRGWAAALSLWSLVFLFSFFFSFCKTVKCLNDAHIIDCITGVVIMRYSEGELFPILFNPLTFFFFVSRDCNMKAQPPFD